MRGIALAWLAGMGLITWRSYRQSGHPPVPGQLLGASGAFALLGLLAEYPPATRAAVLAAWGFDLAALLQILPGWVDGRAEQVGSRAAQAAGEAAQS